MKAGLIGSLLAVALCGNVAIAQEEPPPPGGPKPPGAEAPPPPGGPDMMRGHRPPPPPKGAHFHLQQGDSVVDVKCADDEPMKACAEIVLQLADRILGQQAPP